MQHIIDIDICNIPGILEKNIWVNTPDLASTRQINNEQLQLMIMVTHAK